VSRPVSPHPPSGVMRGARVPRGNGATESLQRLPALECGRFVLPRLPFQPTGRHRSDRREAFRFREAARRQRRSAESHGSVLRKGPPPHGVRLFATERLWTAWCSQGHPKSSHRDTLKRWQAASDSSERPASESLERSSERESRRGRCVGVNAAATGASGPGIRTLATQCAPLPLGGVAEASNASAPLRVGSRSLRLSRLRDQDFVSVQPASRRCARLERGSSCYGNSADPARNGRASPETSADLSSGTSCCSVTSPLRCRQRRRFGARGLPAARV
jgi:hypothetical protein